MRSPAGGGAEGTAPLPLLGVPTFPSSFPTGQEGRNEGEGCGGGDVEGGEADLDLPEAVLRDVGGVCSTEDGAESPREDHGESHSGGGGRRKVELQRELEEALQKGLEEELEEDLAEVKGTVGEGGR